MRIFGSRRPAVVEYSSSRASSSSARSVGLDSSNLKSARSWTSLAMSLGKGLPEARDSRSFWRRSAMAESLRARALR